MPKNFKLGKCDYLQKRWFDIIEFFLKLAK